jgi:rRNA small subunit pseudouridine methyltransferase Nep1
LLTFILAESALETVPEKLWKHPSVSKYAEIRGTKPRYVLLDRSFHHSAMKSLEQNEKRGRPDIVHFALLEALGSPLNKEGLLQTCVHTVSDYVIAVNHETRLPRNYDRFVSLIQQLFEYGRVPPEQAETALLTLERKTMPQLIQDIKPSYVLAFSRCGKPCTFEAAVSKLAYEKNPAVIVGGFPKGHFSDATKKLVNETVCIDPEMLESYMSLSEHFVFLRKGLSFADCCFI